MKNLLLALLLFAGPVLAEKNYFYVRLGLGASYNNVVTADTQKEWQAYDAATFTIGYKIQIKQNLFWDFQYGHGSQLFTNVPFNSRTEITSEVVTIGIEYRIY